MKIYVGHSNEWNYQKELYEPILKSNLYTKHEFIFPHINNESFNSDEIIQECDLFIAEVSVQSLGLGIEIGRAEKSDKRIVCIYMMGYKYSDSLKYVNTDIIEYENSEDMIKKLSEYIKYLEANNNENFNWEE